MNNIVGIIINPNAKANSRQQNLKERLEAIIGDHGMVRVTREMPDIYEVAEEFIKKRSGSWASAAGTGPCRKTISRYIEVEASITCQDCHRPGRDHEHHRQLHADQGLHRGHHLPDHGPDPEPETHRMQGNRPDEGGPERIRFPVRDRLLPITSWTLITKEEKPVPARRLKCLGIASDR